MAVASFQCRTVLHPATEANPLEISKLRSMGEDINRPSFISGYGLHGSALVKAV